MNLLISLINKIKNRKYNDLIEKLIASKDKAEFIFSLDPKYITTELLEIAILTANSEEEKAYIVGFVNSNHIKESKCAEFIIEVLKHNPQRYNHINFDYWTSPEHEDEYMRIILDLGQELNARICGFGLRNQYISESDKQTKEMYISILNNIKESLDKSQEVLKPTNIIDTSAF